tara:strand:- start:16 stop:309 length:294 start_codon:yes stop_codon:yes gene_type:complete
VSRTPFGRIDGAAFAALGASAGVDRLARQAAAGLPREEVHAALRFVDQPVAVFDWSGLPMFLTPTDVMGLAASAVLLTRFAAWAIAPLVAAFRRERK